MTLKQIIGKINPIAVFGSLDREITGINIDSRRIDKGHLFVAMGISLSIKPRTTELPPLFAKIYLKCGKTM